MIHDRLAQSGINQEFGDAGGVGGKRGSPGAFEALAVCEHGIAGHAQGCVCMRSCGWRDDNPWANLSEDVDNCEVFSTKWVGNATFGGDLLQDQVHLLPVVPSSSCGD